MQWNTHEDGDDCVLELVSGSIPDIGRVESMPGYGSPVPWRDTSITKLVVDAPAPGQPKVKLFSGYGLFDVDYLPRLRSADVGQLDTSQSTLMGWMFSGDSLLETITGVENWDTHNVTYMPGMFRNCPKLTGLNLNHDGNKWDTSKVTDMSVMFYNDPNLTTIGVPGLKIPGGANRTNMFYNCPKLIRCSQPGEYTWGTLTWSERLEDNHDGTTDCVLELVSGTVPDHTGTEFATAVPWTYDSVTVVKVDAGVSLGSTGGRYLFCRLSNLVSADVGNLDTSGAHDLYAMFYRDPLLESVTGIENWNTSNVTSAVSMFRTSPKLKKVDLSMHDGKWDTSAIRDMTDMFEGDSELTSIGVPGMLIPPGADTTEIFNNCPKLLQCTHPGSHKWGTLTWAEYLADVGGGTTGCVLELVSGQVPNHTGSELATEVPWTYDSPARAKVDSGVSLGSSGGRYLFCRLSNLVSADVGNLDTSGAHDLYAMFYRDPLLESVTGIENWNTSNVTYMVSMFRTSPKLKKVDLSAHDGKWDTSRVTTMDDMFEGDSELTSIGIPGLEIPYVVNSGTNEMFDNCPKLVRCTQPGEHVWGTSNKLHWKEVLTGGTVTTPDCTLELKSGTVPDHVGTDSATTVPWANETSVTKATADEGVVVAGPGGARYLFARLPNLKAIDVTHIDISAARDMLGMFSQNPLLEDIDGIKSWDTSNITNMNSMFQGDAALVGDPDSSAEATPNGHSLDLSGWNTSNVTDFRNMFAGCSGLQSLDISGWNMRSVAFAAPSSIWNGWSASPSVYLNYGMFSASGLYRLRVGSQLNLKISQGRSGNSYHKVSPLLEDRSITQAGCDNVGDCRLSTPVYESRDHKTVIRGDSDSYSNPSSSTWLYLTTATYDADGGTVPAACGDPVPGAPVCTTATKENSRLIGWKDGDNVQLALDWTVPYVLPNPVAGNKLTALWRSIGPPTIAKATPHSDGSLSIFGNMDGGILAGDKYTSYAYADETGGTNVGSAESAEATAASTQPWETKYAANADPYPADTIGTGMSMWFTGTLKQSGNPVTGESTPRIKLTVDRVAPGVKNLKVDGRSSSSAENVTATVRGVVMTSGDGTAQTGRTFETGDRIVIKWPGGTTSGAEADGTTPLAAGAAGSIVSGSDGSFTVDVPAGVAMDGQDATVYVYDNSDGDGTDPAHPAGIDNKANKGTFTIKLKQSTVSALPFTGKPWQVTGMIALAVVVLMAAETGFCKRRYSARRTR